ncbi:MAG: hypothetical protein ACI9UV_002419, partial [Algoriphagus sp.]
MTDQPQNLPVIQIIARENLFISYFTRNIKPMNFQKNLRNITLFLLIS